MKIRMLTLAAGPDITREAGHVYDVSDKEAKTLIEGGYAVAYKAPNTVERAVAGQGRREQATAAGVEGKPRRGLRRLLQGSDDAAEATESEETGTDDAEPDESDESEES